MTCLLLVVGVLSEALLQSWQTMQKVLAETLIRQMCKSGDNSSARLVRLVASCVLAVTPQPKVNPS